VKTKDSHGLAKSNRTQVMMTNTTKLCLPAPIGTHHVQISAHDQPNAWKLGQILDRMHCRIILSLCVFFEYHHYNRLQHIIPIIQVNEWYRNSETRTKIKDMMRWITNASSRDVRTQRIKRISFICRLTSIQASRRFSYLIRKMKGTLLFVSSHPINQLRSG
jgi:hypothetical protein